MLDKEMVQHTVAVTGWNQTSGKGGSGVSKYQHRAGAEPTQLKHGGRENITTQPRSADGGTPHLEEEETNVGRTCLSPQYEKC